MAEVFSVARVIMLQHCAHRVPRCPWCATAADVTITAHLSTANALRNKLTAGRKIKDRKVNKFSDPSILLSNTITDTLEYIYDGL